MIEVACGCAFASIEGGGALCCCVRLCAAHKVLKHAEPIARADVRWWTVEGLDILAAYLNEDPGPNPYKVGYLVSAVVKRRYVIGECSECGATNQLHRATWARRKQLRCTGRAVPEVARSACGALLDYERTAL